MSVRDRVRAYGKQGTVVFVDAKGVEWVNYDNGSKGPLYPGVDTWVVLPVKS